MSAEEAVVAALARAQNGVDYSPRLGAVCPVCGTEHLPVYKTMPWSGNARVRYHKCPNSACLLGRLGRSVKSIEVEHEALHLTAS